VPIEEEEDKVRTACSRTSCRIVSITILNKYLHTDTSATEVTILVNVSANKDSEKL
jgi:hypothetical protein